VKLKKRGWIILGGAGFVAALVLVIMLMNLRSPQILHYRVDMADRGTPLRTVTIYYLASDSLALAPQQREVLGGQSRREQAQALVKYLSQSSQGLRAALPPGTELVHYFEDTGGLAVLNFNERIGAVRGQGIAEERLRLSALVRTMAENMGEVKRVRLLMLGRPLDSWGAHLVPELELEVSEW
jgi:spore germination protein GerM